MKMFKALVVVATAVWLSGCLATVATVGASLATGIAAGCDNAAATAGESNARVSVVCDGLLGN